MLKTFFKKATETLHNGLMWKLNGQPKSQTKQKKESGLHSICEILCVCLCVALQNRWEGIKCHSLPLTNLILQHFISDLMALHAITRPRVGEKCRVLCVGTWWLSRALLTYMGKRASTVWQMNEHFGRSMKWSYVHTIQPDFFPLSRRMSCHRCY